MATEEKNGAVSDIIDAVSSKDSVRVTKKEEKKARTPTVGDTCRTFGTRETVITEEERPKWLPDDWICTVRPRLNVDGTQKKKRRDVYFYEKKTWKKCRSRKDVERALGIRPPKEPKKQNVEKSVAIDGEAKEPVVHEKKEKKRKIPSSELTLKWQRELCQGAPEWSRKHVKELLVEGFTCMRSVLDASLIDCIMNGPPSATNEGFSENEHDVSNKVSGDDDCAASPVVKRRKLRKRSARQTWRGAEKTLHAHVKKYSGGAMTVLAPAVERSHGRYDFPLHKEIVNEIGILPVLQRGPFALARYMLGDAQNEKGKDEVQAEGAANEKSKVVRPGTGVEVATTTTTTQSVAVSSCMTTNDSDEENVLRSSTTKDSVEKTLGSVVNAVVASSSAVVARGKKKRRRLRGRVSTHNVMLSQPGSALQPTHTDSEWPARRLTNPKPHYYTVLIALTRHDEHTGGTMLYPRTHRDAWMKEEEDRSTHLDLEAGDALVFDGLLLHRGMANLSGTPGHGPSRDRYMYYTVMTTSRVDQNTRVTGV